MAGLLEYKSVFTSTKDAITNIDEKDGIIEGYFSVFGNKDSDKDIIRPGFFTKTLSENYSRIKHLYQHDPWRPLSGTAKGNLVLTQDNYGLKYKSTISKTSYGKDMILLHVDGVIDENSIGFQTTQSKELKGEDGRELIEGILWEGSSVTWGSNERALSKSLNKDELCKKMDTVMKAIRNGKYENEDLFDSLEIYFKQLQSLLTSLTTKAAEEAPKPDYGKEIADAFKQFNSQLILQ